MSSIRLRCDPARIGDPLEHVRRLHGPTARLLRIEEVRTGGIAGFFARRYLELVVEIPDPEFDFPDDIEATADMGELSTERPGFTRVLGDLQSMLREPKPLAREGSIPRIAILRRTPGELIMVAGLLDDALPVAAHLAGQTGLVRVGGGLESHVVPRIDDRRAAVLERQSARDAESAVLLAWGLGRGDPDRVIADIRVRQVEPDRLWVVVDPARKHEDTKAWIAALATHRRIDAYLPIDTVHTASPGTVGVLGLPRGEPGAVG